MQIHLNFNDVGIDVTISGQKVGRAKKIGNEGEEGEGRRVERREKVKTSKKIRGKGGGKISSGKPAATLIMRLSRKYKNKKKKKRKSLNFNSLNGAI